ncbi:MAG: cytochrome c peroxidase [Planctomycetota bacterium]|nr:cytochrome c peroxidase [Planctomycetota bacterium]
MRSLDALILILLALCLPLTACGGGGGTTPEPDAEVIDPGEDPVDPPTDPLLDTQLQPLLQQANAAPPPPATPHSPALVSLGQALFFDKLLSGNRNISCASCHHPSAGTGDGLSVSIGEGGLGQAPFRQLADGALIPRNAPHLWNLGRQRFMFWDGRVERTPNGVLRTPEPALNGPNPAAGEIVAALPTALAAQAIFPPTSREEMRGQPGDNELADATDNLEIWRRIMVRLVGTDNGATGGLLEYQVLFQTAFPAVQQLDDFNIGHVGAAIAAFIETAFDLRNSPYDQYLQGDVTALTDDAKRGAILYFGRADCARCHGGPELTDNRFHSIGVPQVGPGRDAPLEDLGRISVTNNANDLYMFKTPHLRNTALNGPWMHSGAYTTLENAVRHYINPAQALANYDASQLDPLVVNLVDLDPARQAARAQAIGGAVRRGVNLTDAEVAQLVLFLESLTDPAALTLPGVVPATVPSGLPVGD